MRTLGSSGSEVPRLCLGANRCGCRDRVVRRDPSPTSGWRLEALLPVLTLEPQEDELERLDAASA